MFAGFLLNRVVEQAAPTVAFHLKRCLRARLNTNACDDCLTLCKKQAVTLSGRKILFSAENCTDCMACVSGCPNDAFDSGFDLSVLLDAVQGKDRDTPVFISCSKAAVYENQVNIPCAGLLSESVLAALHCTAKQEFYLDLHRCADCRNGHVLDLLHERIQGIAAKRGTISGLKIRYVTEKKFQPDSSSRERRGFLRNAALSLKELGLEASLPFVPQNVREDRETEKKEEQKEAPATKRLLRQALALPENVIQEKELLYSYFYTVTADSRCDLCPLCTGICPTGALKRRTEGNEKVLAFIGSACSGCGLCESFCRKKALTVRPGAESDPDKPLIIA
jgi:ferredoxin